MALSPSFNTIYKSIDGVDIDADVYLPQPSSQPTQCPVLIDLHGGAFMLGASELVNKDQIADCLSRGWIVVVPNHRLCPQVNLLEGPIQDIRDLLSWIHDGSLDRLVTERSPDLRCDLDHVLGFGTSSGGTLALSLGFDVPRPVAGIYDMYGPCNFSAPSWLDKIPSIADKLPPLSADLLGEVYSEKPIPTRGGVSLEGQISGPPDFSDPRQAFTMAQLGGGTLLDAIFPSKDWDKVDPIRNISKTFPPTFIVHGQEDKLVPMQLSLDLYAELRKKGVECCMVQVPGEGHTFAAQMKVGSQTWALQRKGFDFLEGLIKKSAV